MYALEGASMGSVPILPLGTGALEIFTDHISALSYEQDNLIELSDRVLELTSNNELWNALSQKSFEISKKWTWDNYAAGVLDSLKEGTK